MFANAELYIANTNSPYIDVKCGKCKHTSKLTHDILEHAETFHHAIRCDRCLLTFKVRDITQQVKENHK